MPLKKGTFKGAKNEHYPHFRFLVNGWVASEEPTQRGPVEVTYEAVVDATHELLGDPSRIQVPLFEQIPAEALVFIYPSRFCQSDLLARLTKRESTKTSLGSSELRGYVIRTSVARLDQLLPYSFRRTCRRLPNTLFE